MIKRLKFPARYFRTIPLDEPGYEIEEVEIDPSCTAFIGMHCWNIGCEDGPPIDPGYCVGMGTYESFKEAKRIMYECIRPAMDAARKAGILVCHVENESIAAKHPEAQAEVDPSGPAPSYAPPAVVPGWREKIMVRSHGRDYSTKSPYARMDRAKIVAPQKGEPFVYQTNQFDRILRRHAIENLIYSGFATDMCILRAPGGIEPMAGFGYRLFLMRDATVGIEFADTLAERPSTSWAIRYFETHYGDTLALNDFFKACGE